MKVVANTRSAQGSGASRRLRRSGKAPGILYGGNGTPTQIEIDHNPLYHSLRVEAFHSSILDMELDGKAEPVLLRSVQWHPYKPQVLHIDFQRVAADQKIHMKVPLHYKNQEISPAVKLSAALISFVSTDIEVICLPKDLPSFIEVDLSALEANKSLHIREIPFPEGVAPALRPKENPVIVTASIAVIEEEKPAEGAAPAAAGKGAPAAKAAAKPAAKK